MEQRNIIDKYWSKQQHNL